MQNYRVFQEQNSHICHKNSRKRHNMKEDRQQTAPNVLIRLAHLLGTEVKNRRLEIPEKFGRGYCTGFIFNKYIRMLIMNYELYDDLAIENPEVNASRKTIFFKFQNIFPKTEALSTEKGVRQNSESANIFILSDYFLD
jgi:hypothetical protein